MGRLLAAEDGFAGEGEIGEFDEVEGGFEEGEGNGGADAVDAVDAVEEGEGDGAGRCEVGRPGRHCHGRKRPQTVLDLLAKGSVGDKRDQTRDETRRAGCDARTPGSGTGSCAANRPRDRNCGSFCGMDKGLEKEKNCRVFSERGGLPDEEREREREGGGGVFMGRKVALFRWTQEEM